MLERAEWIFPYMSYAPRPFLLSVKFIESCLHSLLTNQTVASSKNTSETTWSPMLIRPFPANLHLMSPFGLNKQNLKVIHPFISPRTHHWLVLLRTTPTCIRCALGFSVCPLTALFLSSRVYLLVITSRRRYYCGWITGKISQQNRSRVGIRRANHYRQSMEQVHTVLIYWHRQWDSVFSMI